MGFLQSRFFYDTIKQICKTKEVVQGNILPCGYAKCVVINFPTKQEDLGNIVHKDAMVDY
jgi:hypothetical protein